MNKSEFYEKVSAIQAELKAPKSQFNKFGNYSYRNCEDILEAVKPLLCGLIVIIDDDIIQVGDRFYVKSTATITGDEYSLSCSAFARESLTRKGMDDAQITGATSSYSRKYAMNGLFLIDDTKDADSINDNQQKEKNTKQNIQQQQNDDLSWYNDNNYQAGLEYMTGEIRNGTPPEQLIKKLRQTFKVSNKFSDLIKSI